MTVYLDEIFFVNLLMDLVVLWAVAFLLQREKVGWRLFLAALLGAIYGAVIFLPECFWLSSGVYKVICAFLMAFICFGWPGWVGYFKAVVYLYLVSFAFGGSVIALMYFAGEQIVQTWNGIALVQVDFNLFWLFAGTMLLFVFIRCLRRSLQCRLEQTLHIVTATIVLRGKIAKLRLLVDSGNCLSDPISGKSVVVAETNRLDPLFETEEFAQIRQNSLNGTMDIAKLAIALPTLVGRIRLIPYQTVGYQGLLLAIRCDALQIPAWNLCVPGAVVALSPQRFSTDGSYQGIMPLDLQ